MIGLLLAPLALAEPFGDAHADPGTRLQLVHETSLDLVLAVELAGRRFEEPIRRRHREVLTVERLARGFEVAWEEDRHVALEPGHAHDRALAVEGRSYRVDGTPVRRDGAPLGPEEAAVVGATDPLGLMVTLRAMLGPEPTIGVAWPAGPMFAGLMADAPGVARVEAGTLTLTTLAEEDGRSIGIFALDLHLVAEGEDPRGAQVLTRAHLTGVAVLDRETGWTRRFDVEGPVSVTATRPDLHTTGTGTFRSTTRVEPLP